VNERYVIPAQAGTEHGAIVATDVIPAQAGT